MNLFKKKESLVENIAFFGIMTAINIIFIVLATYVPFLLFLLVFLLSFTSAFVILLCKKRYFLIFLIATIGISLIINIPDTLFFIIPALLSGFIFGILIGKKLPRTLILLACTVVHIIFSYISYYVLIAIYTIDLVEAFFLVFKLENFVYRFYLVGPFIYLISFGQTIISYIVLKNDLPKLGFVLAEKREDSWINIFVSLSSLLLMIVFILVYKELVYLFYLFSLTITIAFIIQYIRDKTILSIVFTIISFFLTIFTFAFLYEYIEAPLQILVTSIFFLAAILISILNKYLFIKSTKYKINLHD